MGEEKKIHILTSDESCWTYYNALIEIDPRETVPDDVQKTDKIFNVRSEWLSCTGQNLNPHILAKKIWVSFDYLVNSCGSYSAYPDLTKAVDPQSYQDFLDSELIKPQTKDRYHKLILACDVLLHNDQVAKPEVAERLRLDMYGERMHAFMFWANSLDSHGLPDGCDTAWRCIGTLCAIHKQWLGSLDSEALSYLHKAAADKRFPRGAEHAATLLRSLSGKRERKPEPLSFSK